MDLKEIVVQFNDCITAQDVSGLGHLMADDHAFIDSEGGAIRGKVNCLDAWRGFFSQFPDYKNVFNSLTSQDNQVIVIGYSICSEPALDGPALWTAKLSDGKVVEWRVYTDTPENRRQLDLPPSSSAY
jgi:ketosteroid isomerase-like protein